jgi:hypothetical protein
MSSENQVSTVQADPNPSTHVTEPPRSPLKMLFIIAVVLVAVLVFGALDR